MAVVEKDDPDKVKTFVGVNGVARRVQKIYIGVNGVARKVKKVYIGVNGVAKLCWSGETVYTWEQWNVNTSQSISTASFSSDIMSFRIDTGRTPDIPSVQCYSSISISNGTIVGSGSLGSKSMDDTGRTYFFYDNTWYYYGSGFKQNMGERVFYRRAAFECSISTNTTKGSNYLGTVQSSSPSAYPTNGAKNGYWYVKK